MFDNKLWFRSQHVAYLKREQIQRELIHISRLSDLLGPHLDEEVWNLMPFEEE